MYTVIIIFFFLIYAICIILYNTFVVNTGFLKVGGGGEGRGEDLIFLSFHTLF